MPAQESKVPVEVTGNELLVSQEVKLHERDGVVNRFGCSVVDAVQMGQTHVSFGVNSDNEMTNKGNTAVMSPRSPPDKLSVEKDSASTWCHAGLQAHQGGLHPRASEPWRGPSGGLDGDGDQGPPPRDQGSTGHVPPDQWQEDHTLSGFGHRNEQMQQEEGPSPRVCQEQDDAAHLRSTRPSHGFSRCACRRFTRQRLPHL